MSSQRVLFVIESLSPGGAEHALLGLTGELRGRGHECELGVLWPPYTLADSFAAQGVPTHRLDLWHRWNIPEAGRRLVSVVRRVEPTIVHGHLFFGGLYVAAFGGSKMRAGRVVTFHNLGYEAYPAASLWRRWRKQLDAYAMTHRIDHRIAVSAAVARHYSSELGIEQIEVIPNGIDVTGLQAGTGDRREVVLARYGLSGEVPLIVCPGRFRWEKGHRFLLEAARLLSDADVAFRLVLAGEGPLEGEIIGAIRRLGLADRVSLPGHLSHEDLMDLLRAADVVTLASTHEGSPVAVAEAMALGTPVVATRVGGIPEMIEDGCSGLLVSPRESGNLARALARLLGDPQLCRRLTTAARSAVAEVQDIRRVATRHEHAYDTARRLASSDDLR